MVCPQFCVGLEEVQAHIERHLEKCVLVAMFIRSGLN